MNQNIFNHMTGSLAEHHRTAEIYRQINSDNAVRKPGYRVRLARALRRTADRLDNSQSVRADVQPA